MEYFRLPHMPNYSAEDAEQVGILKCIKHAYDWFWAGMDTRDFEQVRHLIIGPNSDLVSLFTPDDLNQARKELKAAGRHDIVEILDEAYRGIENLRHVAA